MHSLFELFAMMAGRGTRSKSRAGRSFRPMLEALGRRVVPGQVDVVAVVALPPADPGATANVCDSSGNDASSGDPSGPGGVTPDDDSRNPATPPTSPTTPTDPGSGTVEPKDQVDVELGT